jgi:16S rRNA (cytosine967-C5)-methyltransferase
MKSKVLKSYLYQKGDLIFQDKASAAVVNILDPQPKELICDMCAAPGIKTSYIAQKMRNQGKVIAGEFLNTRIRIMIQLLKHLNVINTYLLNIDSIAFPLRFQNMFDRILLDAPCTGSGTFLANPELKWRQNPKFLHQNILLQKKLFQSALNLLKPGGILVYSTCSLYLEEGEHIIMNFLNQLEPQDLPTWFSPSYKINGSRLPGAGRLFPSKQKTQGFFVGKFKKKAI